MGSTLQRNRETMSRVGNRSWAWFLAATILVIGSGAHAATFSGSFQSLGEFTGFNDVELGPIRRNAAYDVLDQLENMILDSGSCEVLFQEVTSDEISGFGTVQTRYSDTAPGYHGGDAFEHLTTGVDPDPEHADIVIQVHFDVAWYISEPYCAGCAPDLRTLILSLMLRGLGLQSALTGSGGSSIAPGVYTLWDRLLITGRGEPLLAMQSGTPTLAVGSAALIDSQIGVRFDGGEAAEALGEPPFVNVMFPFAAGDSLQFFNPGTTLAAAKERLNIATDVRRRLMPVDIGALRDIGYDVADAPADLVITTLNDTFDAGDVSSVDALNATPGANGISLREAIAASNATQGPEIVRFGVTGLIIPQSPLPVFIDDTGGILLDGSENITLDGISQAGGADGIEIQYSNSLIRGLRFVNFPGYAIAIRSYGFGGANRVVGCWVGLDAAGNPAVNNGSGILIQDSSSNVIGGTVPSARNVIGGFAGNGVHLIQTDYAISGNVIIGNYIGLAPNGAAARTIVQDGVRIEGADNTLVGSLLPGGRNYLGRSLNAGISVTSGVGTSTRIINNYIGMSADGAIGFADGGAGIAVATTLVQIGGNVPTLGNWISGGWSSGILAIGEGANELIIQNNTIGLRPTGLPLGNEVGISMLNDASSSSILNNIIAGNTGDGVLLNGAGNGIILEGNHIGTDGSSATNIGNGGNGITIDDTSFATVGLPDADSNVIAHNDGAGVKITGPAVGNTVQNNEIFANGNGGIRLENGANPGALPPAITSLDPIEGTGTTNSSVEFFADDAEQGRIFLTRIALVGTTNFSFFHDLSEYEGLNLTATTTLNSDGSTSEFSEPVPIDLTGPIITLLGANPLTLEAGDEYQEPGATANDAIDGDLTSALEITGSVDIFAPGDYVITYQVSDTAGHDTTTTRTVSVVDTTPPTLELNGLSTVTIEQGAVYDEQGATATDIVDGDLSASVEITGTVNSGVEGDYLLTYIVSDNAGNESTTTRTVRVVAQALPPQVTLAVEPEAATAGTPFSFSATPEYGQEGYTYSWNFAGLGESSAQNPSFTFPAADPGSYEVTLTVTGDNDLSSEFSILVTITQVVATASGRVSPDEETRIEVIEGPLEGALVIIPPGAVDEPIVVAISEVDSPPPLLVGTVHQQMRLEPSGIEFNIPVTVRIPHWSSWYHQAEVEVRYWNEDMMAWRNEGISNVEHVDVGTYHYVQYQTTHFTVFMAKSLVPSGIQGQVFSEHGDMLNGATVTIDPAGINLTCDASGFFTTIADLPSGNYLVEAANGGTHCKTTETVIVGTAELVRQDFELLVRNTDGSCGDNGGGGGTGGCHRANAALPAPKAIAGDIAWLTAALLALACFTRRVGSR